MRDGSLLRFFLPLRVLVMLVAGIALAIALNTNALAQMPSTDDLIEKINIEVISLTANLQTGRPTVKLMLRNGAARQAAVYYQCVILDQPGQPLALSGLAWARVPAGGTSYGEADFDGIPSDQGGRVVCRAVKSPY
jgi:hypothetical protein